jgi:hypothetical protein
VGPRGLEPVSGKKLKAVLEAVGFQQVDYRDGWWAMRRGGSFPVMVQDIERTHPDAIREILNRAELFDDAVYFTLLDALHD